METRTKSGLWFPARPVDCLKIDQTIGFDLVIALRTHLTIARIAKSGSNGSLGSDLVVSVLAIGVHLARRRSKSGGATNFHN